MDIEGFDIMFKAMFGNVAAVMFLKNLKYFFIIKI